MSFATLQRFRRSKPIDHQSINGISRIRCLLDAKQLSGSDHR